MQSSIESLKKQVENNHQEIQRLQEVLDKQQDTLKKFDEAIKNYVQRLGLCETPSVNSENGVDRTISLLKNVQGTVEDLPQRDFAKTAQEYTQICCEVSALKNGVEEINSVTEQILQIARPFKELVQQVCEKVGLLEKSKQAPLSVDAEAYKARARALQAQFPHHSDKQEIVVKT